MRRLKRRRMNIESQFSAIHFCATTPSDVTWPALLQKIANQDESLKHQVGKSVIKVLNFALDGTAPVQYPDSYKYKAAKFNPDLVIVNFVSSHISPLYALSRHPSGWRRRSCDVQLLDASRRHREQEL